MSGLGPETMSDFLFALALLAALGCGLAAGVFFAFSSFVMKGLRRLEPARSVAAMQAINVAAVSFAFMATLFGTALACAAVGGWALAEWNEPFAGYLVAGSALYLVGVIALTIGYHVPRNNALAAVDADGPEAAEIWARYVVDWTRWNHVRAAAALAASAALVGALLVH